MVAEAFQAVSPIVHVVPDLHKEASGVAPAVIELTSELARQGVKIALHTLAPTPQPLPGLAPEVALHVYRRSQFMPRLGWSNDLFQGLKAACPQARIVHVHSLWMMPNIYPAFACCQSSAKLVVSPHGTLTPWAMARSRLRKQVAWYLLGQRRLLERAALFHATSEGEGEDLRRLGYRAPIALIPNGVTGPDVEKPMDRREVRTLLFLARIHPKKGLDLLLRAWGLLQSRFPHWLLAIVGPDNEGHTGTMQALAHELSLERVEFRGPLFGEDKFAAYAQADAYVLPSWSENFGYTVAEALSCGTPAITTRQTPWAVLEREHCGWWIDTGLEPLVQCLEEVLSTSRLDLDRRGTIGRAWVQRELAWPRIGAKMLASYQWLLGHAEQPDWILD